MPRRRPRKRLTRIHAAIDAMSPLGYGQDKVVSVVKKLLKEYGGDDGWPFIEDSAYMVLIEALLEEANQENAANGGNQLMDKPLNGDNDGAASTSTRVGDVRKDLVPQDCIEKPSDVIEEPTCSEVLSSSSGVNEGGIGRVAWKDILPHSGNAKNKAAVETICKATEHVTKEADPQIYNKTSELLSHNMIPLPPSTNTGPPPSYLQPCYGWIENGNETAMGFFYFKPAPTVHGFNRPEEKLLSGQPPTIVRRKKKSRWDQMPTDP